MFVLSAKSQIYFELSSVSGVKMLELFKMNEEGKTLCIFSSPITSFNLERHYNSSKKILKIGHIKFSIENSEIEDFRSKLRRAQLNFLSGCLSLSMVK